jgi:hypothetical protein
MTSAIVVALIGLIGNITVATAFTLMGRSHAKERTFLVNAALSNNTYEFAVRQSVSSSEQKSDSTDDTPIQFPEGL